MTSVLTFEQFQATRVWCDDLEEHFKGEWEESVPGFLYADGDLYIEAPAGGAGANLYRLQLCQDVWVSADLEELERKLYEYGCDEGVCESEK